MDCDTDKLITQYESYKKILKKYFPDPGVDNFLSDFGTRLVTCPRGLTSEEGGEYGGLLEFSSKVAIKSAEISKGVCNKESAIRVSLVHELGKLGMPEYDLFVEQDSSWHREKLGQNFKYNDLSEKMSISHRTLYLLQKYKIELTSDEWLAILLSQGMHYSENSFYGNTKSKLASVILFARDLVK